MSEHTTHHNDCGCLTARYEAQLRDEAGRHGATLSRAEQAEAGIATLRERLAAAESEATANGVTRDAWKLRAEAAESRLRVAERVVGALRELMSRHSMYHGEYPCLVCNSAAAALAEWDKEAAPEEQGRPRLILGTCSTQYGRYPHVRSPECVGWAPCPEERKP